MTLALDVLAGENKLQHTSESSNASYRPLINEIINIGKDFYLNKFCNVPALVPQKVEESLTDGTLLLVKLFELALLGKDVLFSSNEVLNTQ